MSEPTEPKNNLSGVVESRHEASRCEPETVHGQRNEGLDKADEASIRSGSNAPPTQSPPPQNTLAPCPQRSRWIRTADQVPCDADARPYGYLLERWEDGGANYVPWQNVTAPYWMPLPELNEPRAPCPIKDEGEETKELGEKEADVSAGSAPRQKERIVAAAILQDGVVYTGTRHGFIIRDIVIMTGIRPVTGEQGFMTSTGEYVSREIAGDIALRAGQVASLKYSRTQLFSEDVWDIPSGLEFTEKELTALFPKTSPEASPATTGKGPMELHNWARETMRIINRLVPEIEGQAFDPGWFLLRQRLEQAELAMLCPGRATDEQGGLPVTQNSSSPVSTQVPPVDRDWPEDAEHENGHYMCRCHDCGHQFIGHKRRVICKLCSSSPALPLPLSEEMTEKKLREKDTE